MLEKLGPYRKDIQWINGLLFVLFLMFALLIGGFAHLLAPETAKPALANLFKGSLPQTNSVINYEKTRKSIGSLPPKSYFKLTDIPAVGITAGEAAKLDAKGFVSIVSDDLAFRIYEGGTTAFSPQDQQAIGPLANINRSLYKRVSDASRGFWAMVLLFGTAMFIFGKRYGRVFSLGLAIMAATILPASVYGLAMTMISEPSTDVKAKAGMDFYTVLKPTILSGQRYVTKYFYLSLILMGSAFLGRVLYGLAASWQKKGDAETESNAGYSLETGLLPRSYFSTASMFFVLTVLPFSLVFWLLMTLSGGNAAGQAVFQSLVSGFLFGLFFSPVMAYFLKGETITVRVEDKDTFKNKINIAMAQLGFNPTTASDDFLTFKPTLQAGLLAGRFSVALLGDTATIVGASMYVKKLKKILKTAVVSS